MLNIRNNDENIPSNEEAENDEDNPIRCGIFPVGRRHFLSQRQDPALL